MIVEDPRTHSDTLATMLDRELDLKVTGQPSSMAECRNFVGREKRPGVLLMDLFRPDTQGTKFVTELRKSSSRSHSGVDYEP